MQFLPLGRSNLIVSKFCLGTMMFGGKTSEDESIRITRAALAAGVNFVDTADIYNAGVCETIVGKALSGVRDSVVLASKAGMKVGEGPNDQGISRFHIVRALEASLKRLNTDRIDLYYLHWPMTAMNMEESLRALDDLMRAGKICYVAASNFPAWLVCRSNWIAELNKLSPLVCGQYPYNLIERGLEIEILPMAQASKLGIAIYRPVGIGVLTGKYLRPTAAAGQDDYVGPTDTRGLSDERIPKWTRKYAEGLRKLAAYAKGRGHTLLELASAWVGSHPAVTTVIVGISAQSQLEENLRGTAWQLTEAERTEVAALIPTEIFEEAGGAFPGWRRRADIGTWYAGILPAYYSEEVAMSTPHKRPAWDEYYMGIAMAVRRRANCTGNRVGAILVREARVIATGYNGTPSGVTNCEDGGCDRCFNRDKYPSGQGYDLCICVHAEQNALLMSAKAGIAVDGAVLYSTMRPCFGCAKECLQAGVKKVVYLHDWRYPDDQMRAAYEKLLTHFKEGCVGVTLDDPDYEWAVRAVREKK